MTIDCPSMVMCMLDNERRWDTETGSYGWTMRDDGIQRQEVMKMCMLHYER